MNNQHLPDGASPPRPITPPRTTQPHTIGFALTTGQFTRRVVLLLVILGVAYMAWSGIHVLLEAFAGILFAIFLAAPSDWLSRNCKIRYGWALAVVLLVLFLLVASAAMLLANRLANQVGEMTQQVPQSLAQLRDYLAQYAWGRLLLQQMPRTTASLTEAVGTFSELTGLVAGVAHFLEAAIVILFVGIFGAAEPELYKRGLLHLVPPAQRRRTADALDAINFNLRWWLIGQFVLMVLMWISASVGLWLIGVPLALSLGFIVGIMELVPYIGAWISAVPAALIAMLMGPWAVLMVLALFLALHILEGYVLVPLIQRRAVHLPPAFTLVMQILLGELLGFLGLFVAAPLTVVMVVLVQMLYVEDALGDETVDVPGEPCNEEKPVAKEERGTAAI
jgi:predicted PurR-regulated permease PerM